MWSTDTDFACGLTAGGDAYCWGDGLEITSPSYDGSAVPVLPGIHLTSLALGSGMACGIDTAGATVCLHRRYLYRSAPPPPVADGFTSVVVGSGFRCGLRSDGQALCSTLYGSGVGGSWSMSDELTPVQAPQPLVQLSAGGSAVCGLTADGLAYCWTVSSVNYLDGGSSGRITTPVAVGGGHHFVQISAASTHACGVTADGELYCWGDNGAGELGNGSIGGSSDVPVRVSDPA
jgi:alpha-tubulin suppressor-like RCC1 family protein